MNLVSAPASASEPEAGTEEPEKAGVMFRTAGDSVVSITITLGAPELSPYRAKAGIKTEDGGHRGDKVCN